MYAIPRLVNIGQPPSQQDILHAHTLLHNFEQVALNSSASKTLSIDKGLRRVGTPWLYSGRNTDARTTLALLDSIGLTYGAFARDQVSEFLGHPNAESHIGKLSAHKVRHALVIARAHHGAKALLEGTLVQHKGRVTNAFRTLFDLVLDNALITEEFPPVRLEDEQRNLLCQRVHQQIKDAVQEMLHHGEYDPVLLGMSHPAENLHSQAAMDFMYDHSPLMRDIKKFMGTGLAHNLRHIPLLDALNLYLYLNKDQGLTLAVINRACPVPSDLHGPELTEAKHKAHLQNAQGVWEEGTKSRTCGHLLHWENLSSYLRPRLHEEMRDILPPNHPLRQQPETALNMCYGLSLDGLREAFTHHKLCHTVFVNPPFRGLVMPSSVADAESSLAADLPRRGAPMSMETCMDVSTEGCLPPQPPTIIVATETFTVGPQGGENLLHPADRARYDQGLPSTLSREIATSIQSICTSDVQTRLVLNLCGQSGVSMVKQGQGMLREVLGLKMNEHVPSQIEVQARQDGKVEICILSPLEASIVQQCGSFILRYLVDSSGAWSVDTVNVQLPKPAHSSWNVGEQEDMEGLRGSRE